METKHPEGGESPFIVKDDASVAALLSLNGDGDDDADFASCPIDGCGEEILLAELDSHIEMHGAEEQDVDQDSLSTSGEPDMEEVVNASFDTKLSRELRNLNGRGSSKGKPLSDQQAGAKVAWKSILKMPDTSAKPRPASATKSTRRRLGVHISI
jgi:zinc finger-containing ubiquitin peptidase 1